jgi:hypothetical protein
MKTLITRQHRFRPEKNDRYGLRMLTYGLPVRFYHFAISFFNLFTTGKTLFFLNIASLHLPRPVRKNT